MELMSSLLLFALVALLPQALGKPNMISSYNIGYNKSMLIIRNHKNIMPLIQVNSPLTMGKVNDLKSVFIDPTCKKCFDCMERSVKAHKVHSSTDELQKNLSGLDEARRDKRKVNNDDNTKKSIKSKPKKNRAITVFKYVEDGNIYAVKIKETSTQSDQQNSTKADVTCQVYSVQKTLPCESPDAISILKTSKRKISKRSKKDQNKKEVKALIPKATQSAPIFIKRQIDDSEFPDQFMPSIEEMY